MVAYIDFEQPILELEAKIRDLKALDTAETDISEDITRLDGKLEKLLKQTYSKLTPWQKIQVARHPERPRVGTYIKTLFDEFIPMAGDRRYAEDHAMPAGLARFNGESVMVIGQERGTDLQSRLKHNFGMARPEGYRKAQRLMQLAARFKIPILTFVDTPGAYPGVGAEERGQAEAIATSIDVCLSLPVPLIATVIGEGGSGGAIALAAGDRVLMLEHAVYSIISPEGCASILWRSAEHASDAAEALKLTAQDLLRLGVIDHIIDEPLGGAHRGHTATLDAVRASLAEQLDQVRDKDSATLINERREKFLAMGRAA